MPLCLHKKKKKCTHNKNTSELLPCRVKKGGHTIPGIKTWTSSTLPPPDDCWITLNTRCQATFFVDCCLKVHVSTLLNSGGKCEVLATATLSWTEYRSHMASLCTMSNLSFFSKLGMHIFCIFSNPSLKLFKDHTGYVWLWSLLCGSTLVFLQEVFFYSYHSTVELTRYEILTVRAPLFVTINTCVIQTDLG